jgi:hypothetical protein
MLSGSPIVGSPLCQYLQCQASLIERSLCLQSSIEHHRARSCQGYPWNPRGRLTHLSCKPLFHKTTVGVSGKPTGRRIIAWSNIRNGSNSGISSEPTSRLTSAPLPSGSCFGKNCFTICMVLAWSISNAILRAHDMKRYLYSI